MSIETRRCYAFVQDSIDRKVNQSGVFVLWLSSNQILRCWEFGQSHVFAIHLSSNQIFLMLGVQPITRFHLSMLLTDQIIAFHSTKEVLLAKAAEGRLSAHLQQITHFHLSMLLTNQIIAFHSTKEVLLAKAAEGRLSAHLQQFTCSIYLYHTEKCVHESFSSLKMMTYFLFPRL